MKKYIYVKDKKHTKLSYKRRKHLRVASLGLVGLGLCLVLYVVFPLASWQLFYAPLLISGSMESPIPESMLINQNTVGKVLAQEDATANASTWFPSAGNPSTSIHKEYSFSIPKLGIKEAKVVVGSDDLNHNLVHYGGSSLPGEYGNAVIFGHSVLPQFFNPKNYMTIFSTLHTLQKGDDMYISIDSITYKYKVYDLEVVDPSQVSVLEQRYDDKYLSVITCTPPGTTWKRLVVHAKIDTI